MNKMMLGAATLALAAAGAAMAQAPAPAPAPRPAAATPAPPPVTGPGPVAGWTTIGPGKWTLEGAEIAGVGGAGGGSFLATSASHANFTIKFEFQMSNPGNSGVYFRCENMAAMSDSSCYEVNLFDERPDQTGRTGSLVHIQPTLVKLNVQDGKWHTMEVTADGDHFVAMIDGQKTVDVRDGAHAKASPIAIQNGSGPESTVRLRNIVVTPK